MAERAALAERFGADASVSQVLVILEIQRCSNCPSVSVAGEVVGLARQHAVDLVVVGPRSLW